jgi:5-methylthioadenosine/S-adenosylhomocysteine deaminase
MGSDPTKHVLRGTVVTPEQVFEGEVVLEGDTITCVEANCPDPPGASVYRITDAFIFPGFIDAHNHVAYNVFQKWTPPKLCENRGQWQRAKEYAAFKAPYNALKKSVFCEMVKYGELKALFSGITTVQGTAPHQTCFGTLIRNAENENGLDLPAAFIRTFILDVSSYRGDPPDFSVTKSFVIHPSRGHR